MNGILQLFLVDKQGRWLAILAVRQARVAVARQTILVFDLLPSMRAGSTKKNKESTRTEHGPACQVHTSSRIPH